MSGRGRVLGAIAGAAGLAAAGAAVGLARQRRQITRRAGAETPFGTLHSPAVTVVADDGVPLHVEVDEADSPLTLVFSHGYALNLDCWHFQRAAYRGLIRAVYYDQRSHGRSGRSTPEQATIDQLGRDLLQVLDEVVPDGPVVLVGHSMGGMSIIAMTEQHPDLIGDRVVGVGLISTTAGGLDPSRILLPMLPAKLGGELAHRTVRTLARGHRLIDGVRRAGRTVAMVATDLFAFGDEVPAAYVDFVDSMLSSTPFEVVAEFFPSFRSLDKFHAVGALGRVPVMIVCGTADRLTSIGHSRKLHERIEGSTLLECEQAGHMVLLERHDQVDAALDQLVSAAGERVALVTEVVVVPDAETMRGLGRTLASRLVAGDVVVLTGSLGAGKTTLTQGLGAGLGVRGAVTSPTFVIARVHPSEVGGPPLVHVDAYRIGGVAELDDLDLDTDLDRAVTVVEWGEGLAEGLAESRLDVRIDRADSDDPDSEERRVEIDPVGPRWEERC